jgi:hypothetical protein
MRSSVLFLARLIALFSLVGGVAVAQTMSTASTPTKLGKAVLRKQDKQECARQAEQQDIAKRNQAAFVRQCMANRQGARKAAK